MLVKLEGVGNRSLNHSVRKWNYVCFPVKYFVKNRVVNVVDSLSECYIYVRL